MFVVFRGLWCAPGQPVEAQCLADVVLDPFDEIRIFALLLANPGRLIPTGFLDVPTVVDPGQFLPAVVAGLSQ